ncbi:hypothetical protein MTR_3g080455 [Medicago truncatula]|uniref:Uncharacterized protein n=1 Tax=Medicago truncatula TaxID=3880 RepID=A0A072V0A5_MEDTR|nr:hypothetical protein MTR_3g080455 [Medicago truncatula]
MRIQLNHNNSRSCLQKTVGFQSSNRGLSSLTVLDLSNCNLTDDSIPRYINGLSSLERLILSGNNFIDLPTRLSLTRNSEIDKEAHGERLSIYITRTKSLSICNMVDYPYPVYMEIPSRLDNQNFDGWAVAVFVALEEIDEGFLARENPA